MGLSSNKVHIPLLTSVSKTLKFHPQWLSPGPFMIASKTLHGTAVATLTNIPTRTSKIYNIPAQDPFIFEPV
jgi:hypothetical protein